MDKAVTDEPDDDDQAQPAEAGRAPVPAVKNYITPSGLQRLADERRFLLTRERPAVTQVVAWAASNGDRSENADYQYGKRRLREIDRRIRFLTKRIDAAEVVDPEAPRRGLAATRVFFGATVRYANAAGTERVAAGTVPTECAGSSPRGSPGAPSCLARAGRRGRPVRISSARGPTATSS